VNVYSVVEGEDGLQIESKELHEKVRVWHGAFSKFDFLKICYLAHVLKLQTYLCDKINLNKLFFGFNQCFFLFNFFC
jgi:hypothetical protein